MLGTSGKFNNGSNSSTTGNPFAPFAGSNKYTSPSSLRRNGSSTPAVNSGLAAAAKAYANGVLGGLGSPVATKFLGADAPIPGLGLTPAAGSPLVGTSGAVPGTIRGGDAATSDASSGSEDPKFSTKKRRWGKTPIEEEIL